MNNRDLLMMASCMVGSHLSLAQSAYDAVYLDAPHVNTIQLSTGVELQYAEQGAATGTPVILLHGYTDSWYSYEQVMAHLPTYVHVYAISQRGHGLSGKPRKGYAPEDFSADVAAFMEELHIPSAVIVGHSMGAVIAQRFAIDHPERTKGLVLLGAFAGFKNNPGLQEFSKIIEQLKDPIDSAFVHEFQQSTVANKIDGMEMHTYVSESRQVPARVWIEVMKGLMPIDYVKDLKKIDVPVLIVYGNKDGIVPATDQDILAAHMKHVTRITYDGVGHGLHWEKPKIFANDLLTFINKL